MYIKSYKLIYKSGNQEVPHVVLLPAGVVALRSIDNRYGKTTIMRLIASCLFSSTSYLLPDFNNHIISFEIEVVDKENSFRSVALLSGSGKVEKIVVYKNGNIFDKSIFEDVVSSSIPTFINNDVVEKIKSSWIMPYFLLDQDVTNGNLIGSFNRMPFVVPSIIESWLLSGDNSNQIEVWTNNASELKKVNYEIAKLETIKRKFNKSCVVVSNKDIEIFDDKLKSVKDLEKKKFSLQKQYSAVSREIISLENIINKIEPTQKNNGELKKKSVYVNAIVNGEEVQAKVDINNLLGFALSPFSYYKNELLVRKDGLDNERKVLSDKIKKINDKISEIYSSIPNDYVSEDEMSENINSLKIIDEELASLFDIKKNIEGKAKYFKAQKAKFQDRMFESRSHWEKITENTFNDIVGSGNTKSGADLFADRVSKFLSLQSVKVVAKNFPFLVDSIKESDLSSGNAVKVLNKLVGMVSALESFGFEQIIVTFTDRDKTIKQDGFKIIDLIKI